MVAIYRNQLIKKMKTFLKNAVTHGKKKKTPEIKQNWC